MKLTDNVHILKWVDEMAALTKPERSFGSTALKSSSSS